MMEVLRDGRLHTLEELRLCLSDELGPASNVKPHLHNLRRKLLPTRVVLCQYDGAVMYRLEVA